MYLSFFVLGAFSDEELDEEADEGSSLNRFLNFLIIVSAMLSGGKEIQ